MNAWPGEQSIMVMVNGQIHHNPELVDLVNAAGIILSHNLSLLPWWYSGCLLVYLPPYSPDLNPIEESFSTCMSFMSTQMFLALTWSSESMLALPCFQIEQMITLKWLRWRHVDALWLRWPRVDLGMQGIFGMSDWNWDWCTYNTIMSYKNWSKIWQL